MSESDEFQWVDELLKHARVRSNIGQGVLEIALLYTNSPHGGLVDLKDFAAQCRMTPGEATLVFELLNETMDAVLVYDDEYGKHNIRIWVRIPTKEDQLRKPLSWRRRSDVFLRDGKQCQYCGKEGENLLIDHIVPISKGGNNDLENLTVACRSCNSSKRNKSLEEWGGPK